MDKLKKVIEDNSNWDFLEEYINRIVTYMDYDFSLSFENAKALLEATGKEICAKCGKELRKNSSINGVMKQAFGALGFTNTDMVRQVSTSLATIGQKIGDLRNEIGSTSHGKTSEEIRNRNDKVDVLTKEFLIDSVEIVCLYLIRSYQIKLSIHTINPTDTDIVFNPEDAFNSNWDEKYGDFTMGEYSYPASEILFNVDKQAYVTEYKTFSESEDE